MARKVKVPYDFPFEFCRNYNLNEREMEIIKLRLLKKSLREIGEMFGISHEYVRRIETIALCKMRHVYIIDKLGKRKSEQIANIKRRKFL